MNVNIQDLPASLRVRFKSAFTVQNPLASFCAGLMSAFADIILYIEGSVIYGID